MISRIYERTLNALYIEFTYINFEDDRLYPLELKSLDDLLESYYELYPTKRDEKIEKSYGIFENNITDIQQFAIVERIKKYIRNNNSLNIIK